MKALHWLELVDLCVAFKFHIECHIMLKKPKKQEDNVIILTR